MKNPDNNHVGLLLYHNTLREIDALIVDGADLKKNNNQVASQAEEKLYVSYKNHKVYDMDLSFKTKSLNENRWPKRLMEYLWVNLIYTKAYFIDSLILIRNFIYCKFH